MQVIAKDGHNELELRTTKASIRVGKTITIGDYVLPGPGEYEVQGVMADVNGTVVRLDASEMVIGYVAPDAEGKLADRDLEELGAADIVCLRIGEQGFSAKEAAALIAQIEAPMVIPVATNSEAVTELCGSGVVCEVQSGTLKVTRAQLPEEGTQVITFS